MSKAAADLLAKVAKLEAQSDAKGLVDLENHPEKAVRKGVRKALHKLRSKGVEIPTGESRSWSTGNALHELRGTLESAAILDVESVPGAIRLALTEPDDEDGGVLYVAALGPDDRMLDFSSYAQSDGQRRRMLRDWDRTFEGRRVPAQWAKERLRYAREATVALGFEPPPGLDSALPRLGEPVQTRPQSFLPDCLGDTPSSGRPAKELLPEVGARWPVLFDATELWSKIESAEQEFFGEGETSQADRLVALAKAAAGDAKIREALSSRLANLLEDAAAAVWLHGKAGDASALLAMVGELRSSDTPETLPWVPDLLMMQLGAAAVAELGARDSVA